VTAGRLTDSEMLLLASKASVEDSKGRITDTRLRLASLERVLARGRDNLQSSVDCLGRARTTLRV